MVLTIAGAGYVGFSNAVLFAKKHKIKLLDVDTDRVAMINEGIAPLSEKKLNENFEKVKSNITATVNRETAYKESDLIILAVPTNYDIEKNYFDTSILDEEIKNILSINEKAPIIIKSTIPIGYTKKKNKENHTNRIVFSPEFLREGSSMKDVSNPERVISGFLKNDTVSEKYAEEFNALCSGVVENNPKYLIMNSDEAESVKLFANTYLAMRVAFFNELDSFAMKNGLNAKDIIDGVCADSRIGKGYSNPSFGFGGYCLPKDTRQLSIQMSEIEAPIIKSIPDSNDLRIKTIADEICKNYDGVIGIYGLAMKSGSDNARESAVIKVAQELKRRGRDVLIYDENLKSIKHVDLKMADSKEELLNTCNVIIENRKSDDIDREYVFTRDLYHNG